MSDLVSEKHKIRDSYDGLRQNWDEEPLDKLSTLAINRQNVSSLAYQSSTSYHQATSATWSSQRGTNRSEVFLMNQPRPVRRVVSDIT